MHRGQFAFSQHLWGELAAEGHHPVKHIIISAARKNYFPGIQLIKCAAKTPHVNPMVKGSHPQNYTATMRYTISNVC